jgi:hypothetical protein
MNKVTASKQMKDSTKVQERKGLSAKLILKTYGFPLAYVF